MGKYEIQNKMKLDCRCSNSNVGLYATAVVKNTETNELHLQVKFKNLSKRVMRSVTVHVQAWDAYGNPLKGVEEYTFTDIMAMPHTYFADRVAIPLPSTATKNVIVNLVRIQYADGEIWENSNYIPFRKVKWYKRFLPLCSIAIIAAVVLSGSVFGMSRSGAIGRGFKDIPFDMLKNGPDANQVVEELGDNYATMSDGNQNFLNYGTYSVNGEKGNLELYFDEDQKLSKMVWNMGYAPDNLFSSTDLENMADYLNGKLQCEGKEDKSKADHISYTWSVDGISYELNFQKTSRGNAVTLSGTSDGSTKL